MLVLCTALFAFGQEQTGSIEGVVKDPVGAVVPSVSVTIKDAGASGAGFSRTVTTDGQGFFRVLQIPPGAYTVTTASTSGFSGSTVQNVRVVLGRATQLDIALTTGTQEITVDVSAVDAPLDTTTSAVTTSLSAEKLEMIPKGTTFTSALKASPGTRPDSLAGGWSVDGATSSENQFILDGQEVTNYRNAGINTNYQVPFSIVQELQVKTSGFDAEYGGATGGVFSVVTKGGNNDWHGEFGSTFNAAKLDGSPRPTLLRFTEGTGANYVEYPEYISQPNSGYLTWLPTANLSGPIIKDRVWFFGSWSPRITTDNVDATFYTNQRAAIRTVNTSAAVPNGGRERYTSETISEYGFGRIDAQPFSRLRLTGTYLWNPVIRNGLIPVNPIAIGSTDQAVDFGGTIGRLQGADLRRRQGGRDNAQSVTAAAVYNPFNWLIASFRYSRSFLNARGNNYFVPSGNQYSCHTTSVTGISPGECAPGSSSPSTTQNLRDVAIRTNYEGDATFLFNAGGRHQLKGGYQTLKTFNDRAMNFSQIVFLAYGDARINSTPFQWSAPAATVPNPNAIGAGALQRFGSVGVGSGTSQSFYVQDKWQIQRLTLNLGVRSENEDVPSFNEFGSGFNFGWGKKVAPRFGASYDVFGDGTTKVWGSYGRFFDHIKFIVAQGSFGGDFYRVDFFDILPNSGPYTSFTTASIVGNYTDPIGGSCPTTGFIGSGLSRCQTDFRVASNDPRNDVTVSGGIDPDAKPYEQREFSFGIDRELSRNYVLRGRYVNKKLLHAIDDAGALNADGSAEIYITGNPGEGLHAQFLKEFGYPEPYYKPRRDYQAVEVVLEKRLSNNYFFNINYTYSRLRGNYSGLANSDETSGGLNGIARSDPGVNRSFDLPSIGGTARGLDDYGPLATDRPHVLNAFGAYIYDWGRTSNSTQFSVFQTIQSGTPQTTFVNLFAATVFDERGDLGRSPRFSQTDFSVSHTYRFGRDNRFGVNAFVNILNLFDQDTWITVQNLLSNVNVANSLLAPGVCAACVEGGANYVAILSAWNSGDYFDYLKTWHEGTATVKNRKRYDYGMPNRYQAPRNVTFGFGFTF